MVLLRLLSAVLLLAHTTLVQAGFSILGTRVIYDETAGEASVHLQRVTGEQPVLLQAWLDDASPSALPGTQSLPFLLTPAVARVDAGGAQVIRIFRVGETLPTDRETLFFFNVLEVPAESESTRRAGENALQIAMQSRLKFFYRPKGLTPEPTRAPERLRFTVVPGATLALRIDNPTPYHITLPRLALYAAHASSEDTALARLREHAVAPMVAPFATLTVALERLAPDRRGAPRIVRYSFINDQGGLNEREGDVGDAG